MIAWFGWNLAWFNLLPTNISAVANAESTANGENHELTNWLVLILSITSIPLMFGFVNSRLIELSRRARTWPARQVGLTSLAGMLGCWTGWSLAFSQIVGFDSGRVMQALIFPILLISLTIILICSLIVSEEPSPPARFFLFDRSHVANRLALRSLITGGLHALLVALAIGLALQSPAEPDRLAPLLSRAGIAYIVGIALSLYQRYPQCAAALIPVAAVFAVIAFICTWIAPGAQWPILLLGVSLGLAHAPPRNDLLANLPPRQRLAGLTLMVAAQAIGLSIGIALVRFVAPIHVTAALIAILLAAAAVYSYLRDLIELLLEPVLAVAYTIRPYGPARKPLPRAGRFSSSPITPIGSTRSGWRS